MPLAYVSVSTQTSGFSAAWTAWNQTAGTTTCTLTDTWTYWTDTSGATNSTTSTTAFGTCFGAWVEQVEVKKENRRERRLRQQREAQIERENAERRRIMQEQQRQREAVLATAEERAEQLLLQVLTPEQERAWKENRFFFVVGSQTRKRYRIAKGSHGNIVELDAAGKQVASLCVNVPRGLPNHDNVLAQKLMLECHEMELLRIANRRML